MATRNYQIRGLTEEDLNELRELARLSGRSCAGLIRHILRLYIQAKAQQRGAEAQQSA